MSVIGFGVALEPPKLSKTASHQQASSVYMKRKRLLNPEPGLTSGDASDGLRKGRFNSVLEQHMKGTEPEAGDPINSPLLEEI